DPRVSLLAHAAERIALVLERVRIYEREHDIASTLQRDLLPHRLPDVAGLTLAAHFHAGGDGTQVGGDWYDAIALPGGRLGLVVRRGEGIDDGLARMTRALGAGERDLGEIQRTVLDACLGDGSSDDDVTALLVRVEPELGERARFTLTPDADTLAALRRMLRR